MSQKPADQNISRAIDLAQRAAKARTTGQPNLAALYEKNALEIIREDLARVRKERVKRKPDLAFKLFAEDLARFVEKFVKIWQTTGTGPLKSDFALAGPAKGGG